MSDYPPIYRPREDVTLYLGDCLDILPTLTGIDAVVTDPPYSSGGQYRSDRVPAPSAKYYSSEDSGEFAGDNRDQRSFLMWATWWLSGALAATKVGGALLCFIDWRQLPTLTDAVQCAGWIWRNLVTWWKPGIRMQKGRFSSSSELIVYGSHGPMGEGENSVQNVLSVSPVQGADKDHSAEKPIPLLVTLMGVTSKGITVLDPFMGSGTTGVACIRTGRRFIGIEIDPTHYATACRRIDNELQRMTLPMEAA